MNLGSALNLRSEPTLKKQLDCSLFGGIAQARRKVDPVAGSQRKPRGPGEHGPSGGGQLLSRITSEIVSLVHEHYGRGPVRAKTYALDNLIVCVLWDGLTPVERTMIAAGEPERVLALRRDFQRLMETRYSRVVEDLAGRRVLAFLSQVHVDPDITVEMFLMDGPVPGFGTVEQVVEGPGEEPEDLMPPPEGA